MHIGILWFLSSVLVWICFSFQSWAYTKWQAEISGPLSGISHQATVVLPEGYEVDDTRYPVLYLLHGWSDNHTGWAEKSGIGDLADQYGLIVVMPDGGYDSWYVDSPLVQDRKYGTYIGKDVVNFVDGHFRTVAARKGRAISGLSMGGFGALSLALRYPETFGAAGSTSGGVDFRDFPDSWGLKAVFGDPVVNADVWDQAVIVMHADGFIQSKTKLIIDCGVEDFFIKGNRALHTRLSDLGVPHDYIERPGGHDWDYWRNAIKFQMLYFSNYFFP